MKQKNYLVEGAHLLTKPTYRRFILIPIFSNFILFILCLFTLITFMGQAMDEYMSWATGWFSALEAVIWIIFVMLLLFLYSVTFTSITNLIAAPFNGLLAEKIQIERTGNAPPSESIAKLILRTSKRELQKLLYFFSTGLFLWLMMLLFAWIPIVNLLAPLIGFIWAFWVLSIQYLDYPADNNQMSFASLRKLARQYRKENLFFGGTVFLAMMIPVVNIFAMSAAVAGGTLFWLDLSDNNTH